MQVGKPIETQFVCILDRDNALTPWDLVQECSQQRRLPGASPASHDQIPASTYRCGEELKQSSVDHSQAVELSEVRELESVSTDHQGRSA
jgi:hypothetical protein